MKLIVASIGGRVAQMRARITQDLVRLAQLADLALQRLDALALIRRRAGAQSLVALSLAHPIRQRLRRAANLGHDPSDCRPLRGVIRTTLLRHPDGAFTNLRRELR
jgi:hypothetical protein